jgi:hypothetical protein
MVRDIRENLPKARIDPLQGLRKQMEISNFKFKLKPVHPELILKIITNLRNLKAVGFDDIEAYVLKMVIRELTPAITHIVYLSIRSSVFPSIWKYSKVIPLLKPGAEDQLN